jgi:hypothetical protein
MRTRALATLAAFLLLAGRATADHQPEWLIAKSKPEKVLMGISIEDDATVGQLKKRFGAKPAVEHDKDFPNEATYTWESGGVTVCVTTLFRSGTPVDRQVVYAVQISGRNASALAKTARGLKLGDGLDDIVRIYGHRYACDFDRRMSNESLTVAITFENETKLSAGFSDAGTIISLALVRSNE